MRWGLDWGIGLILDLEAGEEAGMTGFDAMIREDTGIANEAVEALVEEDRARRSVGMGMVGGRTMGR